MFRFRDYGHFAKDCPNMRAADSEEPKKMHQVMNTEEDRTCQLFTGETCNSLPRADSEGMTQQLNKEGIRMKDCNFSLKQKL